MADNDTRDGKVATGEAVATPIEPAAATAAAAPVPTPPPILMPPWKAALYMISSLALALTQGLGMNLAFANLTQIQGTLAATTTEAAWLSAAYMAPSVSLSIALFKIRAQFGLRNFAEVSIIGFLLASIMNLFVSDLQSALVVRFLSGIAGAPLSTLAFLYMLEVFPPAKKLSIGLSLALMNTTLAAPVTRLVSPALLDFGQWHGLYMLEMALALMVFPIIYLLPLTPIPRAKVITFNDVASYLLIALGFGGFAVILSVGRLYWWFEAPWIGVVLAASIVCLTIAALNELRRKTPLVDFRWLFSRPILHFALVLLVFRLVASVQTSVTVSFHQILGLQNEQAMTMYWLVLGGSIVAGLFCAALMKHEMTATAHVLALSMIAIGCFLESQLTNLTRPDQMLVGQTMMAAGGALFLPPAMATGFKSALQKGPNYIMSFLMVFLFTQSIGGLIGSAFYGTLVTIREKFHSNVLVEHTLLTDPLVAQRVSQLSAAYGKVITDKVLLNAEGLALLGQQVTKEANMLAYSDAFYAGGVMATMALAALLIHLMFQYLQRRLAVPQPVLNS